MSPVAFTVCRFSEALYEQVGYRKDSICLLAVFTRGFSKCESNLAFRFIYTEYWRVVDWEWTALKE